MVARLVIFVVLSTFLMPVCSFADEEGNILKVKGEASMVVKPDIAHFFLRITGEGENYDLSNKKAKDKISQLNEILKTILQDSPELNILKVENKPKSKSIEDAYQKDFIVGMAKAIKGEMPEEQTAPVKKEMTTATTVYFSLSNFSDENILKLMNALSEKGIAFDKSSMFEFDMPFEYTFNKSAIFYGVMNSDKYLETLALEAYKKATLQARLISQAVDKKLGKLVNITGCGEALTGGTTLPDQFNLTGKNLGPLSVDSSRLTIKFSKDFGFRIE
ncbi:MAG: SIMPL domain-containing protein [Nitrospirota bacterium]